jgi:glutamate-1-semialdehyde 2,1-aminomutase
MIEFANRSRSFSTSPRVFNMKPRHSEQLFRKSQELFVGGVNSPVRSFKAVGGTPRFIARGSGAWLWDADSHRYIDFCNSWGATILGHAPTVVASAVTRAVRRGMSFGAPTEQEAVLGALIQKAFPSMARMRFVSSGTEAVMSALRVARAATQRDVLVKFGGCYHGHADAMLVKAGSGALTLSVPDSAGIPASLAQRTRVLPYNDVESIRDLFRREGQSVAAVIVEPIAANMGVVAPRPGFLEELRQLTTANGALLIFDEVITGFRVGFGGAQALYKVTPDLTCLGKIVGGGLPLAVYGGRRDLMDWVAPLGPVYQAGTLAGNPVAVAAGLATLTQLKAKMPYKALDQLTAWFVKGIEDLALEIGLMIRINRVGSMWSLFFNNAPVVDLTSVQRSNTALYAAFFQQLLERGVYLPPSPFETAFLSTAHTRVLLKKALAAIEKAFKTLPLE